MRLKVDWTRFRSRERVQISTSIQSAFKLENFRDLAIKLHHFLALICNLHFARIIINKIKDNLLPIWRKVILWRNINKKDFPLLRILQTRHNVQTARTERPALARLSRLRPRPQWKWLTWIWVREARQRPAETGPGPTQGASEILFLFYYF